MFDLHSPKFQELCDGRFHYGTRAKGLQLYQAGKVVRCQVVNQGSQSDITAQVRGTAPEPYEVTLKCWLHARQVFLSAQCSCPIMENCKHIYAVLLQARDQSAPAPISRPGAPRAPRAPAPPRPPQLSAEWQQWLKRITKGAAEKSEENPSAASGSAPLRALLYVLKPSVKRGSVSVEFFDARFAANGVVRSKYPVYLLNLLHAPAGGFPPASDRALLRRLFLSQDDVQLYGAELKGQAGAEWLGEIVPTGRCHWMSLRKNSRPLSVGAPRAAKPIWRTDQRGWQEPALELTLPAVVLPLSPPWYVDEDQGCCGPLETGLPGEAAAE